MGDKAGLTDDCTTGESRDRASLDLPGVQEDLVRAVVATGTPVVLVLVAGRPIGSACAHEQAAAVLLAWLPGRSRAPRRSSTSLSGEVNPGGKLPDLLSRAPSGRSRSSTRTRSPAAGRTGRATTSTRPSEPLYPFGHGLSYTTFELSDVAATAAVASSGRDRSR